MESFPPCFAQLTGCIRESSWASLARVGAGAPAGNAAGGDHVGDGGVWGEQPHHHLALSFLFHIEILQTLYVYFYKPHDEIGSLLFLESDGLDSSFGQQWAL